MNRAYGLTELATLVEGTLHGHDDGRTISGVNDLAEAAGHEASWLSNPKYLPVLGETKAGVVLASANPVSASVPLIHCKKLDHSIARLLETFAPLPSFPEPGVHSTAVVHSTATIGKGARIGPHAVIEAASRIGQNATIMAGAFIGQGVSIGDDCIIWPHVVIRERCIIGHRVHIHANSVIGKDGFGFYFDGKAHQRIPHIGAVRIEDDVEIGSCACVDRSKFGFTVIGKGTKIDNHVQVAHNVRIGEHCILAGHTGIAGSTRIGPYCVFGGRAGASDNLDVGRGARVALHSMATKDIPAGMTVSGYPAQDHRKELRAQASYRKLPEIIEQLKGLIARVEQLEASTHHQP